MSKFGLGLLSMFLVLAILPFVLVARSRASRVDRSPIHLVLDMDNQPRFDPQSVSPIFADGRAMRPEVPGTVAQADMSVQNELLNDADHPHLLNGAADSMMLKSPGEAAAVTLGRVRPDNMTDDQFAALQPPTTDAAVAGDKTFYVRTIPSQVPVTADLLQRGQERFNIYCSPCHGQAGYGDGMVHQHAFAIQQAGGDAAGWVQPQNLHDTKILARPDGHIFNTITNGARSMPAYDKQISVMDRWAIVAYVRVLQRSQQAQRGDLTAAASSH